MRRIRHDELQPIITQLDQAIHSHEQWLKALHRTLTCRSLCDERDMNSDAYRKCLFGQWYYNYAPKQLLEYPAFLAIEDEHRHMHEVAAKVLSASAADIPISPFDYDEMTNAMERLHLQIYTLKRELEDSVYNLDPLTGAYSRLNMLTKLREQQELVKRNVLSCCIAIMDLDNFKAINDSYGHPTGDRVLSSLIQRLVGKLRTYDAVFRYGGEEFLISMPNADLQLGRNIMERLREEIASRPFDCAVREPVCVTASSGVALLEAAVPVEKSIDYADKALLAAKAAGRNCTRTWNHPRLT